MLSHLGLGTGLMVSPRKVHWRKISMRHLWIRWRMQTTDIVGMVWEKNTKRQNPAMILFVHCQLVTSSSLVTTGAKTIVPKPEPHVEIPEEKCKRSNMFQLRLLDATFKLSNLDFLLLNLTSDKRSLLLKPVTNGSDGRNIHKPETKPADNPVRDLWMVGGLTKGKGRRTHHQDVDVGREGWHKDCCGRDTSSSCEKKDWV